MKTNKLLYIFAFSIFMVLTFPNLLTYGNFIDGIFYASISRNLAEGVGSLWKPQFTETFFPIEFEHLPFAFWLQSIPFRILGDVEFLENFWSLSQGFVCIYLIGLIHQMLTKRDSAWLPILLFAIAPLSAYAFIGNLLDNTITLFCLLATLFIIKSMDAKFLLQVVYSLLSGLCLVGSSLIKGPAGSFILFLPVVLLFTRHIHIRKSIWIFGLVLIGFLVPTYFVYNNVEAMDLIHQFYKRKADYIITNKGYIRIHSDFFWIMSREIGIPLVFCLPLLLFKKTKLNFDKNVLLFLLLGLMGSFPYVFSRVPLRYVVPATPYYILALSSLFIHFADKIEEKISNSITLKRNLIILSSILFLTSFGLAAINYKSSKHLKEYYDDFVLEKLPIKPRTKVTACNSGLLFDLYLVAVLQRTYRISLHDIPNEPYLLTRSDLNCKIPDHCFRLNKKETSNYRSTNAIKLSDALPTWKDLALVGEVAEMSPQKRGIVILGGNQYWLFNYSNGAKQDKINGDH